MTFGLPEKQMVLLQMAVLMFALPQPYCFNFIEASFSGSLFHHFPQPNPATYCRRRTVDEYHELGV